MLFVGVGLRLNFQKRAEHEPRPLDNAQFWLNNFSSWFYNTVSGQIPSKINTLEFSPVSGLLSVNLTTIECHFPEMWKDELL